MKPDLAFVEGLAREAGEIIRASFGKPQGMQPKGVTDLVTEADLKSEAFLIDAIRTRFPSHQIIAEESGVREGDTDHVWFLDPLDGTLNYAHGVPIYAVSIGYANRGSVQIGVVYNPQSGECYTAVRGQGARLNGVPVQVSRVAHFEQALLLTGFPHNLRRTPENNLDHFGKFLLLTQGVSRLGSAALDLCFVAAGRFDGYWEIRLNPWDIAAGSLIVEEAGGIVTSLAGGGDYLSPPCSILAANPYLHPGMLSHF